MSEKITFKQLVELISSQADQSRDSTNTFIHELVSIIETGLRDKGSVSISGFGKFELRWMQERTGVNPQTGQEITIPGQNKVVFKPFKSLREQVNRPYAKMEPQVLNDSGEETDNTGNKAPQKAPLKEEKKADKKVFEAETDTDLVVERSKPEEISTVHETEPDDEFSSVFDLDEESHEPPKAEKFIEPKKAPLIPVAEDRTEMAEKVKKAGKFNWSYAAAAIAATLVIFVILFLMMRPADTATETAAVADAPQQELAVQADQSISATAAEPDPVINTQTASDTAELPLFEYEVNSGESLWTIAEAAYGDPYLWPIIFNYNTDRISNPNVIQAGAVISIPSINDPQNLTANESEMAAEGYYNLYQWSTENNPEQSRYFLWAAAKFSPEVLNKYSSQVNSQDLVFARRR